MEHAFISLILVIDRKDFEQAYPVGHKKTSVIVVQYYSHQQKFYCGFKCLEIYGFFCYFYEALDVNSQKPIIYCVNGDSSVRT